MSDSVTKPPLTTYEELKTEEARLKEKLQEKRKQIQGDLKSLRDEFKPVIAIAKFIGQFTSPEESRHKLAHAGANATIDALARKFFPGGNFLLKFLVPKLVKNYASPYVDKVVDKAAPALRRLGNRLQAAAHKDDGAI